MTTLNFATASINTINDTNNAFAISQADVYDMVMASAKEAEGKWFASIPMSLLKFDPTYQRNEMIKESTLKRLADNWDENMCYPIIVSPHPEESCFMVIDGGHRVIIKAGMGAKRIAAYVLMNLANMEPKARQKEEARMFARQSDNVDKLSAVQRHDANVLIGNPANVEIASLAKEFNVQIKPKRGVGKANTITGLGTMLSLQKYGNMHHIFEIVCTSGWNKGTDGFSAPVIYMLNNILSNHPDRKDDITVTLIDWFRTVEPKYIQALGNTNYPQRKSVKVQMTLVVEDYLHRKINLPYTYTQKHGIKIAVI